MGAGSGKVDSSFSFDRDHAAHTSDGPPAQILGAVVSPPLRQHQAMTSELTEGGNAIPSRCLPWTEPVPADATPARRCLSASS